MRRMRSLTSLCLACVLLAGCGGTDLDEHESAFVDHDFGVQRADLNVGQVGGCDTSAVTGLTAQLFEEVNCIAPNAMTQFGGSGFTFYSAVEPYLNPGAVSAIKAAQAAGGTSMTVSSAYRSVAQQYLLYQW